METLKSGMAARFDTHAGLIPCKVLRIKGASGVVSTNQTVTALLTAYHVGCKGIGPCLDGTQCRNLSSGVTVKKAIYINPTEHFEAMVVGEPQALVSIGLWTGHKGKSITLSFETTQGEEPNDASSFTVCTVDGRALLEALQRLLS